MRWNIWKNDLAQRKNVTELIFRKASQFDIFCRIYKLKRKTLMFQSILKDLHIQDKQNHTAERKNYLGPHFNLNKIEIT